jgi:hypothetical protein
MVKIKFDWVTQDKEFKVRSKVDEYVLYIARKEERKKLKLNKRRNETRIEISILIIHIFK